MHYKTIMLSDIHLGTKDCKSEILNSFLKSSTCDNLYLVGDIIDGWKIQHNKWHWRKSHNEVIRKILSYAKSGVNVTYITGNHDEFLRPYAQNALEFSNIKIVNSAEYIGINNKKFLIVHGDMFDGITNVAKWLVHLGDRAYDVLLWTNNQFNWFRRKLGFGYWSLSKYLKHKVKNTVSFIFEFENNMVEYTKRRGYDGVICGHIHTPEIKNIEGIMYMNCGDYVENCSALVEHVNGEWEIIFWKLENK